VATQRQRGPRRPVVHDISAGGVVYRLVDGKIEVVLVGTTRPERWTLPKGTIERGERPEETARREVSEETGIVADVEAPLGAVRYWFTADHVRHHKTVHFYLMRAVGGDVTLHDREHEVAAWFPAEEALKKLSYASEVQMVERALATLRERSQP